MSRRDLHGYAYWRLVMESFLCCILDLRILFNVLTIICPPTCHSTGTFVFSATLFFGVPLPPANLATPAFLMRWLSQ